MASVLIEGDLPIVADYVLHRIYRGFLPVYPGAIYVGDIGLRLRWSLQRFVQQYPQYRLTHVPDDPHQWSPDTPYVGFGLPSINMRWRLMQHRRRGGDGRFYIFDEEDLTIT